MTRRQKPGELGRWRQSPSLSVAGFVGVALLSWVAVGSCTEPAQAPPALPSGGQPRPIDAIRAVIEALQAYPVVAIGESHNLKEAGAFYESLVAADAFSASVDDIVVEFGNSLFQSTIDRYVSGKSVPRSELKRVWQDTTQVGAWDAPMYEAFFTAVRRANAATPVVGIPGGGDAVRVLLGDPPIDWSRVHTKQQVHRYLVRREAFMAHIIEDVLPKEHHAIVIAGLSHVERSPTPTEHPNVTGMIDKTNPGAMYVVGLHLGFPKASWEQELSTWTPPAIAALQGTWIGGLPKGGGLAEDALDAMLFLGLPDSLHLSIPLPNVYRDDGYWRELHRRWRLDGMGHFSQASLFRSFSNAGYPGLFTQRGILQVEDLAMCIRAHGVEEFPAPQFQYDSVGFYGSAIQKAMNDPDFKSASATCHFSPGRPTDSGG